MPQFSFPFQNMKIGELSDSLQKLIDKASRATSTAYAPYSHFKVGAAVLLNDGSVLIGTNHENAAYPAGICAERAALSSLNMSDTKLKVLAIAITYHSAENFGKPIAPCGICRQTILEVQQWQQAPIAVYMCSPDGEVIVLEDASCLLPFAFGSEYLSSQDL